MIAFLAVTEVWPGETSCQVGLRIPLPQKYPFDCKGSLLKSGKAVRGIIIMVYCQRSISLYGLVNPARHTMIYVTYFLFFSIIVCAMYTGRPNSKINANIKATLHYIKLI